MMDTSLLDAINASKKARRKRLIYSLITIVIVVGVGTTVVLSRPRPADSRVSNNKADVKDSDVLADNSMQPTPSAQTTTSSSPNPPPPAPLPSASQADMDIVNAKLCKSMIDNAKSISESYNRMYMDAWKGWNQNFAGRYDSPEAKESQEWNKSYIKKLYADFINSNDASSKKVCKSTVSLADILIQPNYDAWQ